VPEPALELSTEAPLPPPPPRTGAFDATSSRQVRIVVDVGGKTVALGAWCRVGVWTTLDAVKAKDFTIREAWGRLGDRPPRLLTRIYDQAFAGVIARLRPESDGSTSFHIEIAAAEDTGRKELGEYHGRRISLVTMRRHGFRFRGRAPKGFEGVVARFTPGVLVHMGRADVEPVTATRFTAGAHSGLVVGRLAAAETFVEEWLPEEPIHIQADGVERKDYRLRRKRSASGFRPSGDGWQSYGATFDVHR